MLKLYVWENVLCDYWAGVAFALAHSPDEAKRLIIENGVGEDHWDGLQLDGQSCDEYDEPAGFHKYGGG